MEKDVLIIGAGITGLKAALTLNDLGIGTVIIEKTSEAGGRVKSYSRVFPDFSDGRLIVKGLIDKIDESSQINLIKEVEIRDAKEEKGNFIVTLTDNKVIKVRAIIVASGFNTFDPTKQTEYGYGVYQNVVTSIELESLLNPEGPTKGKLLKPLDNKPAKKIAIIFCVGSRSKRLGNPYCSRICCSYSTKQAIEIKEQDREANVTCFYMDIRTYGKGFEEMYSYAQELGVKYVRGRVSECSMDIDGNIQIRAENTLLGKPIQGIFDLVSLSVGMVPCADTEKLSRILNLKKDKYGFLSLADEALSPHQSSFPGIFLAGSVTGLKPIRDCLIDGLSVGGEATVYLQGK